MLFKIMTALTLLAGLTAGVQTVRLSNAQDKAAVNQVQLAACGARLSNLIEDLESDNAIDLLPDDALTDVPDEWLRPAGAN